MNQKELLAVRLRALRTGAGESRASLAALLDVSTSQISEMENGRGGSTFAKLALLCRHYNVTADYLLGLIDEPRPLTQDLPPCGGKVNGRPRAAAPTG